MSRITEYVGDLQEDKILHDITLADLRCLAEDADEINILSGNAE